MLRRIWCSVAIIAIWQCVDAVALFKRIVNGRPLEQPQPFLASIQNEKGQHQCTGGLIQAPDGIYSVLTAGHCFADKPPHTVNGRYYVRVNFLKLRAVGDNDQSVVFKINSVKVHENFTIYENGQTAFDIAQLQLIPIKIFEKNLKYLKPMSINASDIQLGAAGAQQSSGDEDGNVVDRLLNRFEKWNDKKNGVEVNNPLNGKLKLSGWGALEAGQSSSNHAQTLNLELSKFQSCADALKFDGSKIPPESVICAQGQDLKSDSCQGDSGGPLYVDQENPVAIGLTAFGDRCASLKFGNLLLPANVPAVYTNISYFQSWINNNLKQMKKLESPQLRKRDLNNLLSQFGGVSNILKSDHVKSLLQNNEIRSSANSIARQFNPDFDISQVDNLDSAQIDNNAQKAHQFYNENPQVKNQVNDLIGRFMKF
ncbi:hypothetical protein MP228_011534 [Amoeboaphelidium protococcarum]|nr:hypothetical protein MP228_011534 [Amoeboaphelidium protococcarum]